MAIVVERRRSIDRQTSGEQATCRCRQLLLVDGGIDAHAPTSFFLDRLELLLDSPLHSIWEVEAQQQRSRTAIRSYLIKTALPRQYLASDGYGLVLFLASR